MCHVCLSSFASPKKHLQEKQHRPKKMRWLRVMMMHCVLGRSTPAEHSDETVVGALCIQSAMSNCSGEHHPLTLHTHLGWIMNDFTVDLTNSTLSSCTHSYPDWLCLIARVFPTCHIFLCEAIRFSTNTTPLRERVHRICLKLGR